MIRVVLPHHLRTLAGVRKGVELEVAEPVTPAAILDALEARYPTLRGTMRDSATGQRRSLVRFFACGQDSQRAPVGRLAAVPVGHAGRVDLDLAGQPGLAHQVLKHRLGHGTRTPTPTAGRACRS